MSSSSLFSRTSLPRVSLVRAAALLAVGLVSLGAREAHAGGGACQTPGTVVTAATQRFTTIAPGNIVATGNTLGLSKASFLADGDLGNGPGTSDSIGTFIARDPGAVDDAPAAPGNGWFAGTTYEWQANGSAAVLDLPAGSEVLYAELIWGGSYRDLGALGEAGDIDVTDQLDAGVTLAFGGGETTVAPSGPELVFDQGNFHYYFRSADVTTFVTQNGTGEYLVAGVPAVQSFNVNQVNAAGWTLLVAYRDQAQPIRNLSVYVGGAFVDENTTQDYGFSGFCAPPTGELSGSAVITAIEGDANRDGDVLCIAPSETPADVDFVSLEGPNNPIDNFFSSQINDANGDLDTRGTFGNRNQDAFAVANVSGGRQGWDITQLLLSSADGSLAAGQEGATLRTATASDSYLPTGAAFSIDVLAPFFDSADPGNQTVVDADLVEVGDTFTVTVNLVNSGSAPAENLLFFMSLPNGLSLQSFTSDGVAGDIGGDPVEQAELGTGVAEGTLAGGESRAVAATIRVDSPPGGSVINFQPSWTYDWIMCNGQDPIDGDFSAQTAAIDFQGENPTTTSGAGGEGGTSTSTSTASAQGGGSSDGEDEDGSDDGEDEDGSDDGGSGGAGDGLDFIASGGACAVASPTERGSFALAVGLGAVAAGLAARRRRR